MADLLGVNDDILGVELAIFQVIAVFVGCI